MADTLFLVLMKFIIRDIEGEKLTNDPKDNGGLTRFGVSDMADGVRDGKYKGIDIATLTMDDALRLIYEEDYWKASGANRLVPWMALMVLDAAINHGAPQAVKFLQRGLGVKDDGIFGNRTLTAANLYTPAARNACISLLNCYLKFREDLYKGHPDWKVYGKGWMRRLTLVRAKAISLM